MNFLECCPGPQSRDHEHTGAVGAAAFTTVNMGVQSYRNGQVLFWDKEARPAPPPPTPPGPRPGNAAAANGAPPNQIIGWQGGNAGSIA